MSAAQRLRIPPDRNLGAAPCPDVLPFTTIVNTPSEARVPALASPDLLNHPPTAQGGWFARPVRFVRQLTRTLIGPWLDFQTRYNRRLLEEMAALHAGQEALAIRLEQCQQAAAALQGLSGHLHSMQRNVDYALAVLEALRTETNGVSGEVTRLQERVELELCNAVNRELGPGGRLARAGLWFSPACRVGLPHDAPTLLAVTERILEHFFVPTRLPPPPAHVLELGCARSTVSLELASLGYEVTGIDPHPLPLQHPSFRLIQAAWPPLPLPDASVAAVVSLSTLARLGLDGAQANDAAPGQALAEVQRVLCPEGLLLLTVPFGRPAQTPAYRVYDRAQLGELLHSFQRVETTFGIRDGETWSLSAEAERVERVDSSQRVSALALVVARKV